MLGWGDNGESELACPICQRKFPASRVAFLCPEPGCPARFRPLPDIGPAWEGKPVFRPKRYAYSVPCPCSPHRAYVKICPCCWSLLPVPCGQSSTIAVVGAGSSGKTCFTTALIRQIRKELSREDAYEMALEWNDRKGQEYFREQERRIFLEGLLPDPTQKEAPLAALQVTIQFPIRSFFRRVRKGSQGAASLVFHDPSGEYFESVDDVYYLHYIGSARAVILIVDPFTSEEYQARLRAVGREVPERRALSAADALGNFVGALRRELRQPHGPLKKPLAVVLAKCDEPGMFNPADRRYRDRFPVQGGDYDPALAAELSDEVVRHMHDEFGMADVVALARQAFHPVKFFTVSALGQTPRFRKETDDWGEVRWSQEGRLRNARPVRVEEPLLWILHEWGYV